MASSSLNQGAGDIIKHDERKDDNNSIEGFESTENENNEQGDGAIVWQEDEVEDEEARLELGLVGKIWTKRRINSNAFMETMKNVWQPKHGVDISSIGENAFVFQFHHWKDKQRVIEEQPWHFDKHALILEDIVGHIKPSDMTLCDLPMWIRVYNLPFKGRLNTANVEAIGNKVGTFIKMDSSGSMGIDKSIRLRVKVDVRKPLLRKIKVKMRGGVEEFFDVKYEKPPLFCFWCGKIGHGVKDCDLCRDEDDATMPYGGWMKASPWKRSTTDEWRGDSGKMQCARALFVTKPRTNSENVIKEQVSGVLKQLKSCALQEDVVSKNHAELQGDQSCGRAEESEGEGGRKNVVEGVPTAACKEIEKSNRNEQTMKEILEGMEKRKKGWKRANREPGGKDRSDAAHVGTRRKIREGEDVGGVCFPEGKDETNKRRLLEWSEIDYMLEDDTVENVAGPTKWALGGQ